MIRALVLDVDGTLTDGHIYMGENGEIMKAFYAHDAVGIRNLVKYGIMPIIITGRVSNSVKVRAEEMNISEIHVGVMDKKTKLLEILKEYKIDLKDVAYIGDEINDLECMSVCGLVACPNNAVEEVKRIANFISKYDGGYGAVRELCDYLIREVQ